MRIAILLIVFFTLKNFSTAQSSVPTEQTAMVKKIFDHHLTNSQCYQWLEYLCLRVGHRLSGSVGAARAVAWSKSVLDTLGLDTVWLQPVLVPHWERGREESVRVLKSKTKGNFKLNALALGGSVGTGKRGIRAEVVEVKSWDELEKLGEAGVRGKIVFFNRPMDATKIRTFEAYGGAVDQRVQGASRAAKLGAVAVLVRSMGLSIDDFPHTGSVRYDSIYPLIPAAAISTRAAEALAEVLKTEGNATISMKMHCRTLPDAWSYNVIGEIRGSTYPDQVLLVGGHLDSWDVGHGAHDDGAGCVQSMEVLRTFRQLNYRPRHTVRVVLFMNEENGLRGASEYARIAEQQGIFHRCAIESDAGGFTPRGFSCDAEPSVLPNYWQMLEGFAEILKPYGLELKKGGSGADISPLKPQKGLLCGYTPDGHRYFDFHHTAADVFQAVHQRELELGAASLAALIYLIDSK